MTTDTVFSIVSILVVRITKVGYGWKANEFIFPTILRYVMYITYRVFLKMTKVGAFFLVHLIESKSHPLTDVLKQHGLPFADFLYQ